MRLLLTSALELKRDVSFKRREVGLSSVVTCCAHQPPLKCELVIVGPATPWLPSSNAPTPLAKILCYDLKTEVQFKTFSKNVYLTGSLIKPQFHKYHKTKM